MGSFEEENILLSFSLHLIIFIGISVLPMVEYKIAVKAIKNMIVIKK